MPRSLGSSIGPYLLESLLGSGGMGEVYRARDTRLDRAVAIKFLHAGADSQRFQREAKSVAALNHPNILSVFDVGEDYLVTELVEGESLRGRKPSLREAVDNAAQIADGLAAAHAVGITHRDLKPDNIMVTREGRVKILDFGLAKQTDSAPQPDSATRKALSEPGMVMGTVAYMSPEQARGQAADARSDIFSFGSTVYELLSGRQPFQGDSAVQTMSAVIEKDPEPLPDHVPPAIKGIVQRCLEKEPARRFQSASDLAFALRSAATISTTVQPAVIARRSAPWAPIGLALVLVAFIAYIALRPKAEFSAVSDLPRVAIPIEEPSPSDPAFSPDGKSLLYVAMAGEIAQVFLRQLGSPESQQLTQQALSVSEPSWSADGSRFYFRTVEGVYEQPLTGNTARMIYSGRVPSYALTPDGKGLVLAKYDAGFLNHTLMLSEPLGSPPRELRDGPVLRVSAANNTPLVRFSPDGRQLLFAAGSALPTSRLAVMPWPEGSGKPRAVDLKQAQGDRRHSSWVWLGDNRHVAVGFETDATRHGIDFIDTSDGSHKVHFAGIGESRSMAVDAPRDRFLFASRDRNLGAWSYSLTSGKAEPLYDTPLSESEPVWAPDGNTLLFVTHYGEEDELWLKNVKAGWKRVLFRASMTGDKSAGLRGPVFSPDGERLAVTVRLSESIVPSGYALYMILMKSGQATRVPGELAPMRPVDFSPDGKRIALTQRGNVIQVLDLESGKTRELPYKGFRSFNSWSRDGKWIARIAVDGVRLIPVDGGEPKLVSKRSLTSGDAPAHCFSADSSRLYLIRQKGASAVLEELLLATDELRTLATLPGSAPEDNFNRGMRLHPDGKSVVFTLERGETTFWMVDGVAKGLR
ncbi:MAG: protein kinase [Acidobacteria bacterium]|nr:protein kinase [Acidobacteriota bacterium]